MVVNITSLLFAKNIHREDPYTHTEADIIMAVTPKRLDQTLNILSIICMLTIVSIARFE